MLSRYCAIYGWEDNGRLDFEVFMNSSNEFDEFGTDNIFQNAWKMGKSSDYIYIILCHNVLSRLKLQYLQSPSKNSKCGPFVKITTFLLADILLLYFNNKVCLYKDLFRFKRAQKKYNQIGQRKNIIESTKAVLLYLLYYRKSETFKDLYGVENY